MGGAIRLARHGRQPAEVEIRVGRVADRPFAQPLGQFQQRDPAGALLEFRKRGQRLAPLVADRRRLAASRVADPWAVQDRRDGRLGHGFGLRPGLRLRRRDLGILLAGVGLDGLGDILAVEHLLAARLARHGAVGQAEPVHLADHRVAGDAAERLGDLRRRQALGPHLLQLLDPLVGPGHAVAPAS